MPKRGFFTSRKLVSIPQRLAYSAAISRAPRRSLDTRHHGSIMSRSFMHATAAAFHRRLFVTVAPRSVRARPPAPTQSAAFRLSPPALVTTWFPRSRTT